MKKLWIPIIFTVVVIAGGCGGSATAGIPSTPDGTVLYVSQQLADGHPEIVWDALPASYQNDITTLTHEFASKMDAEVWDKTFSVTQKAIKVLKAKKSLFLQTKMMAMAGDKKDEIESNWDTATAVLGTLAESDLSNLETLKGINWEEFLVNTGGELMEISKKASAATEDDPYEKEFLAKIGEMKVEVKESNGDTATVVITTPDEDPEEMKMTRIEGRWVPNDLSKDWEKEMNEARAKLEKLTPEAMAQQKMQFMMVLGMAEGMIDQLDKAETVEQLEQMLGGLFGQLLSGGHAPMGS